MPSLWTYLCTSSKLPQTNEEHIPVHPTGTANGGPHRLEAQDTDIEEPACNLIFLTGVAV